MKKYYDIIGKSPLFRGISYDEYPQMFKCLYAKAKSYDEETYIYRSGDPASQIGLVLSGEIQITREDYFGNRLILTQLSPSDIFGETFALSKEEYLSVNVISIKKCEVLFFSLEKIIDNRIPHCQFQKVLIQNMLEILTNKNLFLNDRINILSRRSTREKLLTFLSSQAEKYHNNTFSISLGRQELADYLSVDRSAMSTELWKMKREGLIEFTKNQFTIK